jgi:hypothetical protein
MSRSSVVGMLVAAEILIVGMAIYAIGHGGATFASGMRRADFTAASIAPIAAGAAPHVVIDDGASRVRVAVSSDDLVHVRDLTQMRGAVYTFGSYPQLRVARTADGVHIERPGPARLSIEIFGFSTQAIEVDLPRLSRLEIARCSGADVFGVGGPVSVQSQDGHVDAGSDDGYVKATNVSGDRLTMRSRDGHLSLANVAVGSLLAQTGEGRIEADGLSVTGDATMQTDDGSINLGFAPDANVAIDASTRDGRIVVDGTSLDRDDLAQRTIRLGNGSAQMKVATGDGSIHIHTNGVSQSDRL